jgi:hypothetical protein
MRLPHGFRSPGVSEAFPIASSIFGPRLDWFWYGICDLVVAIGAFHPGYAIWAGRGSGYLVGPIFAKLNAGGWFLLMWAAPVRSATMVVIWCLVIYALVRTEDFDW